MTIKAIAFDVDGTLYPYWQLVSRAICFGVGNLRRGLAFYRVRMAMRHERPVEDFRRRQAEMFGIETSLDLERAREWIDSRIYDQWLSAFRSIRPYAHIRETLDRIHRLGLKCGIMSDFPVVRKLEYLGISSYPSVAMCSEESGYLKPSPEPFAMLANRLDVAPEHILYVGDHYEYDVLGARAAGFHTAHITHRPRPSSQADLQFALYVDLERFIVDGVNGNPRSGDG